MSTLENFATGRSSGGAPVWPTRIALIGALSILLAVVAGVLAGHRPRFELIAQAPPAVQIHLACALIAFAVGGYQLLGPKGTVAHRTLGWSWSIAMMTAAISSLFVRNLNDGAFGPIHILSATTIVMLPTALLAAHRHRVSAHAKTMTGIYLGGTILAGAFAFAPGRLMWAVFFG